MLGNFKRKKNTNKFIKNSIPISIFNGFKCDLWYISIAFSGEMEKNYFSQKIFKFGNHISSFQSYFNYLHSNLYLNPAKSSNIRNSVKFEQNFLL